MKTKEKVEKVERSVYNHGLDKEAGKIDAFLVKMKKALTPKEIAEKLNLTEGRIKSHIYHLQTKHNVTFEKDAEAKSILIAVAEEVTA